MIPSVRKDAEERALSQTTDEVWTYNHSRKLPISIKMSMYNLNDPGNSQLRLIPPERHI